VYSFSVLLVSSLLAFAPAVTRDIAEAWAANDVGGVIRLLSPAAGLHVSLPGPISFSDRVSREQAYFLFERIFAVHGTYEFVPEPARTIVPGKPGFIFKARWSFRDRRNGNPYLFRLFFYVSPRPDAGRDGPAPLRAGWEIVEIKAERL
jgi:regulator of protease activity HflC (stomatin/prohibitin superfamily)